MDFVRQNLLFHLFPMRQIAIDRHAGIRMNRTILDRIVHHNLRVMEMSVATSMVAVIPPRADIIDRACLFGAEAHIGIADLRIFSVLFEDDHAHRIDPRRHRQP